MKANDSRVLFDGAHPATPPYPPILLADGLRTPENVGALVRLAANVGCPRLLLLNTSSLNPSKIRRTACMALDYVAVEHLAVDDLPGALPEGYQLVAVETTPDSVSLFSATLPERIALVVGSEVHGISPEVLALCPLRVHIPMLGHDTSMNVTHAAAVATFEWVRRLVGIRD